MDLRAEPPPDNLKEELPGGERRNKLAALRVTIPLASSGSAVTGAHDLYPSPDSAVSVGLLVAIYALH